MRGAVRPDDVMSTGVPVAMSPRRRTERPNTSEHENGWREDSALRATYEETRPNTAGRRPHANQQAAAT
jgi:hypothetical protein